MLSYKLGPSQKTLGWLLPGLLWGNGERLVHPFPFLALPRHVRDEPSQKKSDLQWLLDRLRVEQCGNYGWQEGRCVVERRGPARRNHPVPEALKEPQRNWKKNKQIAKKHRHSFFFLLWHSHDIDSHSSLRFYATFWQRRVIRHCIYLQNVHPVSKWPGWLPYMMYLQGCGPISNTLTLPSPSIMAGNNLHLSLQLVFHCLATCFSLARHASGIPPHLLAQAATPVLQSLKPCWQSNSLRHLCFKAFTSVKKIKK